LDSQNSKLNPSYNVHAIKRAEQGRKSQTNGKHALHFEHGQITVADFQLFFLFFWKKDLEIYHSHVL